jgi:hypothetical protein
MSTRSAPGSPVPFDGALYHTLNRSLVGGVAPDASHRAPQRLDAILVPTVRDPRHLLDSLRLEHFTDRGGLHRIPIVLLRSGSGPDETTRDLPALYPEFNLAIVDLPLDYELPDVPLTTEEIAAGEGGVWSDTAKKRNVGLLLAARMSWRNVLFLDDDVVGLGDLELARTRSLLLNREAVGWAFDGNAKGDVTPDNSMVCHVHRLCGGLQDTFIGAGALAVSVTDHTPFFPSVYNEDWLFLAPLIERGTVALAGELGQLPFDPLGHPKRAHQQEFGEVLAVGLFGLLHQGRPLREACDARYWRTVVDRRHDLLSNLERALRSSTTILSGFALYVLSFARSAHDDHWPTALAQYCLAWRADLDTWKNALTVSRSEAQTDLASALSSLKLVDRAGATEHPLVESVGPHDG